MLKSEIGKLKKKSARQLNSKTEHFFFWVRGRLKAVFGISGLLKPSQTL